MQNTIEIRATASEIAAPKPDLDAKAKNNDFEALFKRNLKGKLLAPKLRKSADKSLSQPGCSHSNTIYDLQLQKTIVLRKQPRHQATFIAGGATLHGKTQGFVLRLPPQHKAHATSCSHSNAIWHHSFKKRMELCTQEQPLVAKHIEGTNRAQNDRSRTRRTHEVPFIVACNHFTRKNTRFRAPASSPKHSSCNVHAAIPMRSATTASGNA